MSNATYAFAVAKIRQLENNLLSNAQYEQLINAPTLSEALAVLAQHGWEITDGESDIEAVLGREQTAVWELTEELAGDNKELKIFTVKNDFHNLKAALKAFKSGIDAKEYYLFPASVEAETFTVAVADKNYDLLPEYLRDAAYSAYDKLVTTGDGQTADIIIDKVLLATMLELADKSDSEIVKEYVELTVAVANIKTAYRGALTAKDAVFFENALCPCDFLDNSALLKVAKKGPDEVISMLEATEFSEAADALKVSLSNFEKWYDEQVLSIFKKASFESFGINPIIAYYVAKESEIKNVRMILICKSMGADATDITERMRESYV